MLKAPRFMIEYANHKIKTHGNELKRGEIAQETYCSMVKAIDGAVRNYQLGLVTIDDAMHTINQN